MKLLLIPAAILLTACTSVVPVTQAWPQAPGLLAQEPCINLHKLEPDPKLSQVAKTVTSNYDQYYMCAAKLEAWQRWYREQKVIHESLRK
jgi:hypothetical protein